jgi:hypothetical protein
MPVFQMPDASLGGWVIMGCLFFYGGVRMILGPSIYFGSLYI